jgi:uncharacterized protein (DUF2141 family)
MINFVTPCSWQAVRAQDRLVAMIALFLLLAAVQAAPNPPAPLTVDVQGLRSTRGLIQACVTANRAFFPDCSRDPNAIRLTVPAVTRHLEFRGMIPGRYAVSLVHDENSNSKLDTFAGIPKEGFGFSRSPVVRFGAPKFDQVVIDLPPGRTRTTIRMQYLL